LTTCAAGLRAPCHNVQVESLKTTSAVRVRMSRQKSRNTGIEMALRKVLHGAGFRYRVHRRPVKGVRREADLVFGPSRVAVFVDGCFWHGCPEHATQPKSNAEWWRAKLDKNMARDAETTEHLLAEGWTVLRFWEHETADGVAQQIAASLAARRPPPAGT
jgi:DNA mismatch endonuclease (patch repair protein)